MTGGKTSIGTIAPPSSARSIPSAGPSALSWCSFETQRGEQHRGPGGDQREQDDDRAGRERVDPVDAEQERRGDDDEEPWNRANANRPSVSPRTIVPALVGVEYSRREIP